MGGSGSTLKYYIVYKDKNAEGNIVKRCVGDSIAKLAAEFDGAEYSKFEHRVGVYTHKHPKTKIEKATIMKNSMDSIADESFQDLKSFLEKEYGDQPGDVTLEC